MSKLDRVEQARLSISYEMKLFSLTILERDREDYFHPMQRDEWVKRLKCKHDILTKSLSFCCSCLILDSMGFRLDLLAPTLIEKSC